MQVSNKNNYSYNKPSYNPNFGLGLKEHQIKKVQNMDKFGYKYIEDKLDMLYGIKVNSGKSNTIAYCVKTVVDIFKNAGFILPSFFTFKEFNTKAFGRYYKNDEVSINSKYDDFLDLENQNRLEEFIGFTEAGTGHFLDTYLHEFSHAAHRKHLGEKYGKENGDTIFWRTLSEYNPMEYILTPLVKYISKVFPQDERSIIENVFPEQKIFIVSDLSEYFAQINVRKLEDKLGDNMIVSELESDFIDQYKGFPNDWKFEDTDKELKFLRRQLLSENDETRKSLLIKKITKLFAQIIEYFNGEVWNGNIDCIKDNRAILLNYCTK